MNYRCLIIDDEPPAREILSKYVESIGQIEIIGVCSNALQAIEFLHNGKIDLVFLDIEMPKLSGMDLIKSLPHPPKVIFTTAHKEFALEAFDLNVVDYLLKPISYERFIKSVNKLLDSNFYEIQDTPPNGRGFLYFRCQRKMVKVYLDDLLYVESQKDYVILYCHQLPPLKIKEQLKIIEVMLPKKRFLRVHRSFIVSIDKITAFTKYNIEIGAIEIPIGRLYNDVINIIPTS